MPIPSLPLSLTVVSMKDGDGSELDDDHEREIGEKMRKTSGSQSFVWRCEELRKRDPMTKSVRVGDRPKNVSRSPGIWIIYMFLTFVFLVFLEKYYSPSHNIRRFLTLV